jgi:two-component system, NtrC family, response regulator HydG
MSDHYDVDPTPILRAAIAPVVTRGCVVTVLEGPDAGKRFPIEDVVTQRVLIGQSPVCAVCLTDRTVSRRHAALEGEHGAVRLIDLESSNGTFVNHLRVRDVYLRGGESVRVGSTTLQVDVDDATHVVQASNETRFYRVVGASPEMRSLYPMFARLAAADVPVLIEGETGTGKEVLAESLHEASTRRDAPFVIFDCTTVSPTLLEAELFGHERGAFTGAVTSRRGLFEEAHGGTLFIDEVGDLDIALQAKLLRAIEKMEVRRVGGNRWTRVDVRIVAATRRDLDREVQARRFRDDLFYRLAVARVELPPLRRRHGDVALLARTFWAALGGDPAQLAPDVIQRFVEYSWPGNVRELHNAVARQLALGEAAQREPFTTPAAPPAEGGDFIDEAVASGKPLPAARQEVVAELERRYLTRMLELHGGHVGRAAEACGIGRRYFQKIRAKR